MEKDPKEREDQEKNGKQDQMDPKSKRGDGKKNTNALVKEEDKNDSDKRNEVKSEEVIPAEENKKADCNSYDQGLNPGSNQVVSKPTNEGYKRDESQGSEFLE